MAAPLLRVQGVERAQAGGEAALYEPQSGETRLGRGPRSVALEQFPLYAYQEAGLVKVLDGSVLKTEDRAA